MFAKKITLPLLSAVFFLGACSSSTDSKEQTASDADKLQIVTSFYPVYDVASRVAGDEAEVSVLMQAGQDGHDYEPSAKDIQTIAEADVFIYSSPEMETWVPDALAAIEGSDVVVVAAAADLTLLEAEASQEEAEAAADEDHSHDLDPHVWLDPTNVQQEAQTIASVLEGADAEQAENYRDNADAYIAELESLDQAYETAFAEAANRTFVVQHAAFGYLAHRYGLEQVAVSSLSSEAEASPAQLAEVKDYMEENNIGVIYYDDTSNAALAETLAGETGASLEVLRTIEAVTEEEQAAGLDYIALMEQNLEALKKSIR